MRIEELILEGFKSYPVRTTITGWDPSFNAITGLNGSGKSNILDAICFVLGITNMSQMRAQNQQDLIYKRGQAGVTKASVTIVFDNSDPATSPVGLQEYKQITVTRQIAIPNVSKYLLNGHKSTQQAVQTLFQSVQLNINNPNFLIMQGKITKVLNMRPPEILSLVEEAAGTRMFEERKDKALKSIQKKEKRVQEIESLLHEEIIPKLDALRAEKKQWMEYIKTCSQLEKIGRVLRAYEYTEAGKKAAKKAEERTEKENRVGEVEKGKKDLRRAIEKSDAEVKRITEARAKEMKAGGKYQKLEERVSTIGKEMERVKTRVELKEKSVEEEGKRQKKAEEGLQAVQQSIEAKRSQLAGLEKTFNGVKDKHDTAQTALGNAENLLQSLLTGLSGQQGGAGGGGGYLAQLADARARQERAVAEETQARKRVEMGGKELREKQARAKELEREAGEGKKTLEKVAREVEEMKTRMDKTGWNADKEREVEAAIGNARAEARKHRDNRDSVRQRTGGLSFDYTPPHPNFDRSKVKGLVASLITLSPEHTNKAQALEQAAGGRLYNVVVTDENIGKELLQNGRLKKRVTIIPLNKIQPRVLNQQQIEAAERLAPGRVWPAQSLVRYDPSVEKAIAFTLGSTFICADAEAAKSVTFARNISARSVTLDGDVYEPGGTLSGGAPPQGNGLLVRMQELNVAERSYQAAEKALQDVERRAEADRPKAEAWRRIGQDLGLKQHELQLLQDQVQGSNAMQVGADVEKLKAQLAEHEEAVVAAKDKQKAAEAEAKKLEKDMAEFKNNKDGKIDELKASIAKQKAALQKQATVLKTHQKEVQTATLDLESAEGDVKDHEKNLAQFQSDIAALQQELEQENLELKKHQASFDKYSAQLEEERATLSHFDEELKALNSIIKQHNTAIADADLELTKLDHEIQQCLKDQKSQETAASELERAHEWIEEEKHNFGKTGSEFDFSPPKFNATEVRKQASALEAEQKKGKKKVNEKVMSQIEGQEKQEVLVKKNLDTVLADKRKIESTIGELDVLKRDALHKTWTQVNRLFGDIFADLLPGNFAKLQPPEGQDLTEGLEVKVQLGSVWKQSLTELSGGQRSLIALSLIMSLLQFKPAPMYILDEVDAALDLSHTQHIGQLFRTRFKGSQFIVVSLKEGLFTNANVLFRTRFRDGTSIVERTANRSTSSRR